MELNCVGVCFAHAVGSYQSDQPAVACYRQNRVMTYGLPCAVFAGRTDLKITGNVRISGGNYLRQLERYRLSEGELFNRAYFTDLR